MKISTAILFLFTSLALIVSCIVGGITMGILGFALWPLPTPEVQIEYMPTSEPIIQIITATPEPTEMPMLVTATVVLSPFPTPTTMSPAFSSQLATAYPILQPTPKNIAIATPKPEKPERFRLYSGGRILCAGGR